MITLNKITTSDITEAQKLIPDYEGGNVTRRLHHDGDVPHNRYWKLKS